MKGEGGGFGPGVQGRVWAVALLAAPFPRPRLTFTPAPSSLQERELRETRYKVEQEQLELSRREGASCNSSPTAAPPPPGSPLRDLRRRPAS